MSVLWDGLPFITHETICKKGKISHTILVLGYNERRPKQVSHIWVCAVLKEKGHYVLKSAFTGQ